MSKKKSNNKKQTNKNKKNRERPIFKSSGWEGVKYQLISIWILISLQPKQSGRALSSRIFLKKILQEKRPIPNSHSPTDATAVPT